MPNGVFTQNSVLRHGDTIFVSRPDPHREGSHHRRHVQGSLRAGQHNDYELPQAQSLTKRTKETGISGELRTSNIRVVLNREDLQHNPYCYSQYYRREYPDYYQSTSAK